MIRDFICIICPNGCEIRTDIDKDTISSIEGALCDRGKDYVRQELTNPLRNIASSVIVNNGELPLVSVRLTRPVPKSRIFDVMEEIKKVRVDAPVKIGTIAIKNVLGLNSDVIITKNVNGTPV